MIGYTSSELLLSVLHAAIYGAIFSIIYQLALLIYGLSLRGASMLCEMVVYDKFFSLSRLRGKLSLTDFGGIFAFFSLLGYFIGFLLLSYYSLDGQLRLYMLAVSSATFYCFNLSFCVILRNIIIFLLDLILDFLTLAVRIILLPIRILINIFQKKALNI